jgi:hypothetical protein
MSPELAEYINKLPISTYLLASDTLVIGRVVENRVESVEVKSLCVIDTFWNDDDTSVRQVIVPMLPSSYDQSSIISRGHILVETPASILLKKQYCDTLLQAKVQTSNPIQPSNLENNEPKGYFNKIDPDRWKS